ncbi:hypothetical protein ABNQ39_00430 (plasmid) [Azospirillum sp. A26]|uniref:hypothetical protein n=1 Tax=Azospirillum sp. A26 TaxID=3160607 RepID=UPI00366D1B92
MVKTDWIAADEFRERLPHTNAAMQKFVMSMAAVHNKRGKKTLFGKDKGLDAYRDFELRLTDLKRAMVLDRLIAPNETAANVRDSIVFLIVSWAQIYPNWKDAYMFAIEFFEIS